MFLIILYIISILIFFLLVAPLKRINDKINKKVKKNIKKNSKKKEKFTPKIETKHYIQGFMRPEVAYKANTTGEEKFGFNIHKVMNESKSKLISGIFSDVTNDNYKLFNNLQNTHPLDPSKGKYYQNLHYNPATKKDKIFTTTLPDVDDLELEDYVTPKEQSNFAFIIKKRKNKKNKN